MDRNEILRIAAANDWVWNAWWPSLLELTPEQYTQDLGGSFSSILTNVAHMVGAETVWQMRCEGQGLAVFPPVPDNMVQLKDDWDALAQRRRVWLETAALEQKVHYTITGGTTTATNSLSEIIVHMTSHAHFHRGQLVNHFRALGLKPTSAHFIGFFRL